VWEVKYNITKKLFFSRGLCGQNIFFRGDFYVTEHDVRFVADNASVFLTYQSISVHALSRDESAFPNRPAVFLLTNEENIDQVDEPDVWYVHYICYRIFNKNFNKNFEKIFKKFRKNFEKIFQKISKKISKKFRKNFQKNFEKIFKKISKKFSKKFSYIFLSEYHLVPSLANIENIYEALCQGQSLNPDQEMDEAMDEPEEPINLNNFVWADGYGPEFLTGGVQVGNSGDGNVPNIANLNVGNLLI